MAGGTLINITFITTGLLTGGAEMMLYRLVSAMDRQQFTGRVISLTGTGEVGARLREQGIALSTLDMRPGQPDLRGLLRLAQLLRQDPPDVIQTWMYHADLLGGLAARLTGKAPVIWGIRNNTFDVRTSTTTRAVVWACARLSHVIPRRIVANSHDSCRFHIQMGYAAHKMSIIPNGFDTEVFCPQADAPAALRAELNLPPDTPLVGLFARFDPIKDHHNFVRAAAQMQSHIPNLHFVLCGRGIDWQNSALTHWIEDAGLRPNFHLLGVRSDMAHLNAALDLAVCSSHGEAFPNTIGEAMACGVPCAATDVGDLRQIMGESGRLAPPRDPAALARACIELLSLSPEQRRQLGQMGRARIEQFYSLPAIAAQYQALYRSVIPA